ncbi:MAG: hypothetical protein NZ561_11500, partial [Phycisphaerae bacterium]|nr:hypothetical protein [Phycisphaerae bacterium]MDW8261957.1 hypothetical protein [Phycisphaerales bacterium]
YAVPPMNLWELEWWLVPRGSDPAKAPFDLSIRAVDEHSDDSADRGRPPRGDLVIGQWIRPRLLPTPISWAAKPFEVRTRRHWLDAP